ncbi:uncharacterized protein EI90DRAFT_1754585 [Cantharellus anzutake]|uniref:uncharacterized protein n=1 Tax=Cantharellus anzutake TaxID=1750568 RepID=UPI001904DF74|nr:uncharacterized protein EI90DRAFT_1754585 [Cantharellus anzutake]KAF8341566.1 hypothetical protein EI90DRAFT_1754585 [Cantharellus anzutake]
MYLHPEHSAAKLNGFKQCHRCQETKTGTRFVTSGYYEQPDGDYGAFQFCPSCEETIIKSYDGKALPIVYAFLLKVTLPEVHHGSGDNATVATEEEPDNQAENQEDEVTRKLRSLDERLGALEGKLDHILSILAATHVGTTSLDQTQASQPQDDQA